MAVRRVIAFTAVAFASILVSISPASAGVGLGAVPTMPTAVSVGQTGVPGAVQVTNNSNAPDDLEQMTITQMRLAPSCGSPFPSGGALCGMPDSGVFTITSPAMGEAGTACAGTTFSVSAPDPNGVVTLTPSGSVVLDPPGEPGDTCRVNFFFNVMRSPSFDSQPAFAGVQTSTLFDAIGNVAGTPGFGGGSSSTMVLQGVPSIVTQATSPVQLGSPTSDVAIVSVQPGGPMPTGTVQFQLFGPDDPLCAGEPVFQSTNPLTPMLRHLGHRHLRPVHGRPSPASTSSSPPTAATPITSPSPRPVVIPTSPSS